MDLQQEVGEELPALTMVLMDLDRLACPSS